MNRLITCLGAASALIYAAWPAQADDKAGDLVARSVTLSPAMSARLNALKAVKTTADVQRVRLNFGAIREAAAGQSLDLQVSDSRSLKLVKRAVEAGEGGRLLWTGEVADGAAKGLAAMVLDGDQAFGSLRTEAGELFRIRPLDGGESALIKVDESQFPADEPADFLTTVASIPASALASATLSPTGATIDLMVLYTPSAASASGNINALIDLAVLETNQALQASGSPTRVRLVHKRQVSYADGTDYATINSQQVNPSDGKMDEFHSLRATYGADVGVMIVNNGSYCGRAAAIGSTAANAFAAVHYDCATGYYSFGHEIAHLVGCRHNTEVDPTNTPYADGHGRVVPAGGWRTIMGYACPPPSGTSCPTRIQRFSNPAVSWSGTPTGVSGVSNCARVWTARGPTMAAYVPAAGGGGGASAYQRAYVWANNPSAASYTPSAAYASAPGGSATITRSGVGAYAVKMTGTILQGSGQNVQVTAYGGNARCKIASWGGGQANIRCFRGAAPADSMYTVLVTKASGAGPKNETAYVWGNNQSSASYSASPQYAYNNGGTAVNIQRTGVGRYTVNGLSLVSSAKDNVQVSGYGGAATYCQPASWGGGRVFVACFNAAGGPVDSQFSLLATKAKAGDQTVGYVWGDNPAAASYGPNPSWVYDFDGATKITRSSPGVYSVALNNIVTGRGDVQVVEYGGFNGYCNVASWGGAAVNVRCYNPAGAPADARFSLLAVRN